MIEQVSGEGDCQVDVKYKRREMLRAEKNKKRLTKRKLKKKKRQDEDGEKKMLKIIQAQTNKQNPISVLHKLFT